MPQAIRNYTELSQELDSLMLDMQADGLDIDEALKLYERGQQLIAEMEKYLKQAETKVTKLKAKFVED